MADIRKTFSKIFDQYINKIYRFIFLKVNSQEIAQDLTSETFLRGWEAFQKSQNPKSKIQNPRAFLYQIARNLVIDYYREKGRTEIVSTDSVLMDDPSQNLEERALFESDFDNIRTALVILKEEYQDVIIWHYLDDLSISEIAKMLDKSEEAIRVQLHRALKALRAVIKEV